MPEDIGLRLSRTITRHRNFIIYRTYINIVRLRRKYRWIYGVGCTFIMYGNISGESEWTVRDIISYKIITIYHMGQQEQVHECIWTILWSQMVDYVILIETHEPIYMVAWYWTFFSLLYHLIQSSPMVIRFYFACFNI